MVCPTQCIHITKNEIFYQDVRGKPHGGSGTSHHHRQRGRVVVEVFFQYEGFGKLLLDAALFGDLYVVQAATLAAVLVAVLSQIISDVGYTFLNPRIRFS